MSIVRKILSRIDVLVVTFTDGGSYNLRLVKCRYGRGEVTAEEEAQQAADVGELRKELASTPVLVLIGGYGVITKQADAAADIVAKVTAGQSGFRWTLAANELSFVREEQLRTLEHALDETKAKVVAVQCAPLHRDTDLRQIAGEYAAWWYRESANVRAVLRPSAAGSAMAQLMAQRLRLPVLAMVLLALMINATSSSGVRARYEAANVELQVLHRAIGQTDDATRRQQELIREYRRALPHKISLICDRAAMVLPDGVMLTSLAVQPLLRSIETNRKAMFAYDRIEITGHASTSAAVSDYITELAALGMAAQVQLASMERDRDSGLFNFKITLEL